MSRCFNTECITFLSVIISNTREFFVDYFFTSGPEICQFGIEFLQLLKKRSTIYLAATYSLCNAPDQLATIRAENPGGNRYWRAGVGRIDNEINARWRGVTLCNGSCKLLQLLRKRGLHYTSCIVARIKKRCVACCPGTLLHRAILQQLATVLRCKLL